MCIIYFPDCTFSNALQGVKHGQEEAACLSYSRLWEGVWKDVSLASSPALALRGETLRLHLDVLWEKVHTQR